MPEHAVLPMACRHGWRSASRRNLFEDHSCLSLGVVSCWRMYLRLSVTIVDHDRCRGQASTPLLVASGPASNIWNMRSLVPPFLVAAPTGARIRTRLRLSAADEQVLRAVGQELGHLAGHDVAIRCRLGPGRDARAERKRALTPASSSRWAGSITRVSNDQWQRGRRNLLDARVGLRRACRRIRIRLAVPVGGRHGRDRGYASQAERFQKQRRLQHLEARLTGYFLPERVFL